MAEVLFLYDVEFVVPGDNPPDGKERFAEALRSYFETHDLEYGMSALGGMTRCRGDVRRKVGLVTDDDRRSLANWIKAQHVRCIARLGALEEENNDTQYFRPITEWVFEVDNLTDADRQRAATAWRKLYGRPVAD
jgi:hypothetical protein